MPLPHPNENETREEFVERCMADEAVQGEFPDRDQRYAVCQRLADENAQLSARRSVVTGSAESAAKRLKTCTGLPKSIDLDSRSAVHLISTGDVDRDGDMVEPGGWDLRSYRANPVVLLDHDASVENIIGSGKPKLTDRGLETTTTFHDLGKGLMAMHLVNEGYARAWSVGFRPLKHHWIGDQEDCERCQQMVGKNKRGKGSGMHFVKQELLEYSLVAIPSNPSAVMALRAKGFSPSTIAELVGLEALRKTYFNKTTRGETRKTARRGANVDPREVDRGMVSRVVRRLGRDLDMIRHLHED